MPASVARRAVLPRPWLAVGTHQRDGRPRLAGPPSTERIYLYAAIAALAVAAASMLFATTTSYDPWSWLVWGRQILHGTLHTAGGPTWKPLPMVFTTIFAPFGHMQRDLWIVVARAGALLSLFMIFKLAARLTWWMELDSAEPTQPGRSGRVSRGALAALAGVVAASAMALSGEYVSSSALGYSEGLAIAFALIGLERALDGHHRQAFLAGIVLAWDRPESWILWGPYGLWLIWRDPGVRWLVIGAAVLTLLVWFLPQEIGGGSLTSGVARAQRPKPNSAAFASFPFWAELRGHGVESVFFSARLSAAVGGLAALVLILRHRRDRSGWRLRRCSRAVILLALLDAVGVGWWVLIALETQAGFSGNDRYLLLGSALVCIGAGVTVGWGGVAVARLLRRLHASIGRTTPPAAGLLAATAVIALVYAFIPAGWVGAEVVSPTSIAGGLRYQARLRLDLQTLINRAGGPKAVARCGRAMAENYEVPMVAWYLNLRLDEVLGQPSVNRDGEHPVKRERWPATIFQDRTNPAAALQPLPSVITGWTRQGAHYRVIRTDHMTMYLDCHSTPP